MITVGHIDHFVLAVASVDATCTFCTRVPGMALTRFDAMGTVRVAPTFGHLNRVEIANTL